MLVYKKTTVEKRTMKKISVIIIDKHPVVRHGITAALKQQPNMVVVGESETATSALPEICNSKPDVAIIDSSMTESCASDFIHTIKAQSEKTSIIVYSIHQKHEPIFRAFKEGAQGYVLKIDDMKELIHAVYEVQQGRIFLSKQVPSSVTSQLLSGNGGQGILSKLSKREYEVAKLLSQCMTPDEIGETLCISPRTVRVHRSNIMHKLQYRKASKLLSLLRDYFSH